MSDNDSEASNSASFKEWKMSEAFKLHDQPVCCANTTLNYNGSCIMRAYQHHISWFLVSGTTPLSRFSSSPDDIYPSRSYVLIRIASRIDNRRRTNIKHQKTRIACQNDGYSFLEVPKTRSNEFLLVHVLQVPCLTSFHNSHGDLCVCMPLYCMYQELPLLQA